MLDKILRKLMRLDSDYKGVALYPPGHFYSPLVTPKQFLANEKAYLDAEGALWKNIDLQPEGQRAVLAEMVKTPVPEFPGQKVHEWRYFSENDYFGFASAAILAGMIRVHRPKRIVEVGSGFSSAVMLDVADRCNWDIECTFVEPYPERLKSLLRPTDKPRVRILEQPVQSVKLDVFQQLEANDLLFIDSSHVVKPGSDLADLMFRVIPALKPGVLIHFHDIFYPVTYPRDWQLQGFSWNETFLLRAFLLFNERFKVAFFNQYAQQEFRAELAAWDARVAAGDMSSIWLQRVS